MSLAMPTVTVFGSCRVHTPSSILAQAKRVRMNQQNIFGFTHYTSEILQQFRFVSGATPIPARLRPFLNIPEHWATPRAQPSEHFHEMFAETDVFIIEISSVRQLLFKSVFLQINRTRELLAAAPSVLKGWWEPLVRNGVNDPKKFPTDASPLHIEVASLLQSHEQTTDEVMREARRIATFLQKPVLFVAHFNTDRSGNPIPQRSTIVESLAQLERQPNCAVFDPTSDVLAAGISSALLDLGHYRPEFERIVAERLAEKLDQLLSPAADKVVYGLDS